MSTTAGAPRRVTSRALAALAGMALAGLVVAGCGGTSEGTAQAPAASPTTSSTATQQVLVVADAWVRSTDGAAMSDMSAMFGTLRNPGTAQVTVTGGRSDLAGMVELHETVKGPDATMRMQPKAGGFRIPAGGSLTLEPGGSHVMLMRLKTPIRSGANVTVTLATSGGDVRVTAPARTFAGGQEKYVPSSRP